MKSYNAFLGNGKRVHKIFEPLDYPIRLCSWTIADYLTEVDRPVDCLSCLKKLSGKQRTCVMIKGITDYQGYLLPEYRQEMP